MFKIALIFGGIASLLMFGVGLIPYWLYGDRMSHSLGQIIGYTSILVSLLGIYFGIKSYRDKQLQGRISFLEGTKAGLSISFTASLLFAVFSYLFFTVIAPEHSQNYYQRYIEQIKNSRQSPEVIARQIAEINVLANNELANNMFFRASLMFITVFLIGTIISFISSLILRKT